jgi:hypothetical protein
MNAEQILSLSGEWRFDLDPSDVGMVEAWHGRHLGDRIHLPGTTDEQRKGPGNPERADKHLKGNQIMVEGTDICMPALWCPERTLIAYSQEGYDQKSWTLPPDWQDVTKVVISKITLDGFEPKGIAEISGGRITLALGKGEAVRIRVEAYF